MESEYGWNNVLVFILSFIFGSFLIFLLQILKNFIKSKPPGRRLVTADVHVYQAISQQMFFGVLCGLLMIKAVFHHFSYWATFSIIWLITSHLGKDSLLKFFVVFVSIANISSFLQVAFMFDVTVITDKLDSQILTGCLIATVLQTCLPLAVEFTLMMTGRVPVMTQGSLATYFGGELVSQDIEQRDSYPSLVMPLFFILSLLFQISLYFYKLVRARKHRNMDNNYVHSLKTILVENVLNLYGIVVLIVISLLCCYVVIAHYEDIKDGLYNKHQDEDLKTHFDELFVIFMIMTITTTLPFGRSQALRSYTLKKFKDLFTKTSFLNGLKVLKKPKIEPKIEDIEKCVVPVNREKENYEGQNDTFEMKPLRSIYEERPREKIAVTVTHHLPADNSHMMPSVCVH